MSGCGYVGAMKAVEMNERVATIVIVELFVEAGGFDGSVFVNRLAELSPVSMRRARGC